MGRTIAAALLLVVFCSPAIAGPNSDGAIIVHTNDGYVYDSAETACTTPLGQPASCEDALTQTNQSTSVVWFLAAFPPGANPAVATIYFGIDIDAANVDANLAFGACGAPGMLEIPDAGWPSNDAGNSIGFGTPVVGNTLFRFYYFGRRSPRDLPVPYLCSAINPTGGYAAFFDTSLPPREDRIARFGCVKWYEPGSNSCPQVMQTAACCDPASGHCVVSTQAGCDAPGVWFPEWASCSPNPCPLPTRRAACRMAAAQ